MSKNQFVICVYFIFYNCTFQFIFYSRPKGRRTAAIKFFREKISRSFNEINNKIIEITFLPIFTKQLLILDNFNSFSQVLPIFTIELGYIM
ncbi:hypothetical protein Mgra_00001150 [Meloidogyne graminicola]|uniref:Uncharacterized protein n=1 Tax=Meloidogyne graminicola TaxID=189291 RepID=A0A8T0A3D9_9BILA|nr:hypothetical protein Mgra_00001150 [Meloidogyne graminicola]